LTRAAVTRRALVGGAAASFACLAARASALSEPALAGLRRVYLDGPFGQIHARVAGPIGRTKAPPLVLLHQTPLSGRMFDKLAPRLAIGRTVIAVDTPGYGESDRPLERPSLAAYGDAILAALRPRFGKRFDLLGYHTGAVIAADLAGRSTAVRKLVLIAFPLFGEERRTKLLADLANPAAPYADDGSHLLPLWTGSFGTRPQGQTMDEMARLVAEKLRPGRFREWALHSAMEHDLAPLVARIAKPTLVLAPHDGLQEPTAATAKLIPGARLIDLPGMKYGLFDAHPDKLAAAILPFLD
jgi:pimeloyl-ACP methyl ester carboxylesterase